MLNATLLARPVLSIPANVPLARAAVEIFSTISVLRSAPLELMPSTELANIVHTTARAASDPTPLALPAPTERFSTQVLAMTNVPT